MTLPSDWKMGKCLEWYTEVPFPNRPRESPVFLIQNVECSFQLCRMLNTGYPYYYLYLKPKMSDSQLKSFPLTIYSDHTSISSFSRYDVNFFNSNRSLKYFSEDVVKKRGANVGCGYFLKLFFVFGTGDGPSLPLETKSDEITSQLDLLPSMQTDVEYLAVDLGKLLKSGDYSDVQLQCNGGNIPAHRGILAARSEAFSDLFHENATNQVNLASTEISVMEMCLEYIYKGKISKLPAEKVPGLYGLGHALKIPSLTKMCAEFMISNTSPDSYVSNLVLADRYGDEYFKRKLIDYISHHVDLLKK